MFIPDNLKVRHAAPWSRSKGKKNDSIYKAQLFTRKPSSNISSPVHRMLLPLSMKYTSITFICCSVILFARCESTEIESLFPSLPDEEFKTNNPKCNEDSRLYVQQRKNFTLWAHESKFF